MAAKLGNAILYLAGDDAQLNKALKSSEGGIKGWAGRVGGFLGGAAQFAVGGIMLKGISAIGRAVVGSARGIKDATLEAESAQADLNATLASTKGVAGITVAAANEIADSLSKVTKFDDEVILGGESMLLTFTNIGKDVFPMATEAMLNMAQKMGTDPKTAAIQLGKALNDPIRGITALRRVGVAFSADQEKVIKQLVKTGRTADAQRLILKELEVEFGGVARAAGATASGQMAIFNTQLGNVKESIGGALMPVVNSLATTLGPLVIQGLGAITTWLEGPGGAGLQRFADWLKVEIPNAVAAAKLAWETQLQPALARVHRFVVDWLLPNLRSLGQWLTLNLPPALAKAKEVFDFFKENVLIPVATAFATAYKNASDLLTSIGPAMEFGEGWAQFKDIIDAIAQAIEAANTWLTTFINNLNAGKVSLNAAFLTGMDGSPTNPRANNPPAPGVNPRPGFASGSLFTPGGMAWVGERGPELVNLPRGSRVFSNGQGSGGISLVQNFYGPADPGAVGRAAQGGVLAAARSLGLR